MNPTHSMTTRAARAAALLLSLLFVAAGAAQAQGDVKAGDCASLARFQVPGMSISITRAEALAAGTAVSPGGPPGAPALSLPAHCRVEGVIDRREGVGGKTYGIGFAVALPDNWSGRFLFQGGGGLNGSVGLPVGASAAGDTPALARGYAVVTTDSGHKGSVFDGSFFEDQQASLDFYYVAIGRVTQLAKAMVAAHYGRAAEHAYYAGCSTGGREAMVVTQRYPAYFDGVVSGAPAMRTGYSNLALAYIGTVFAQAAGKDAAGKPAQLFSAAERDLIVGSLLDACDDKDGIKDGMIFNSRGCAYDPVSLACKAGQTDKCLAPAKADALKKALAGPKDVRGNQIYPGFLYDAGIGQGPAGLPGLLFGVRIPVGPPVDAATFDVDREAVRVAAGVNALIGDSTWTNLSTFAGRGGRLLFYHGSSDPWFSALDTVGYYEAMTRDNGGPEKVRSWSRLYLVPGMGHCGGGSSALDRFDMLTAVTDWVEKGTAPESVIATGRAFPGRSRPLCPYPSHAHYTGQGDPQDAKNFVCR